jgi:glycosyltransferase involved in cell wall biosynthesis
MRSSEHDRPDVTIIIPAFNEAGVIGRVLEDIRSVDLGKTEVLLVDDGSTDDTGDVARAAGARVVRHPYNVGNGAAVKTGLRNARGRYVVLMDGDGQHRASDLPALVRGLEEYDMVVGCRQRSGQAGLHRLLANSVYNRFASYVTEFNIQDLTSGMRAMHRDKALQFISLLPNTFSYPTTLTLAFLRSGLTIQYVPISVEPRVGRSKIRLWEDGTRFLLIITRIATLFSPFRVFLPVSSFFFLAGFVYYLYTYFTAGRFTNMGLFLFTTSVVIFMMGLVSEQVAMMRMERSSTAVPVDGERLETS